MSAAWLVSIRLVSSSQREEKSQPDLQTARM
ncbi:unnamed protein product, partial [Rotaria sp. Silwood2]